jgi:hypothetical protein
VAERERQDGVWVPAAWRGGRAAGDALRYYGEQVPIGQRVRQAHLEHFCPGVTGSGPIGLGRVDGAPVGWEGNSTRAAGQRCGPCGQPITPGQDAPRRVSGTWVHQACPS